jgi:hypothetical protein
MLAVHGDVAAWASPKQLPPLPVGPCLSTAAVKALRTALAHPAVSLCTEAMLLRRSASGHLRLTKGMLAKQRRLARASGKEVGHPAPKWCM